MMNDNSPIQPTLLRLNQIIGDDKKNIPPIVPISKSAWWDGISKGKYPKPIKLSANTTVWRSDDIQKLMNRIISTSDIQFKK